MMLYRDLRFGGIERLSIGRPEDWNMRIPDMFLKCVSFLYVETPQGLVPSGTAFFVTVPSALNPPQTFPYLVTAKHCVLDTRKRFLRMNTSDGKSKLFSISVPWTFSSDSAADVAAIQWGPKAAEIEWAHVSSETFATPDIIEKHGIGVGDDLAMIGLFVKRVGKERNIPVVRTGSIAAVPAEPLPDKKTGLSYHAYLAEVRSIGGLSGSPVFVILNPGRIHDRKIQNNRFAFLLGLVRGHWDLNDSEEVPLVADGDGRINVGMAVVTPISDLMSILDSEEQVANRKRFDEEFLRKNSPAEDSAVPLPPESDDDGTFTRDDFEDALKRVSRKLSDEEKPGT